jgi:hypothetical protein
MKVVINVKIGGFGISKRAGEMAVAAGLPVHFFPGDSAWSGYALQKDDFPTRSNPALVKIVEELGDEAGDRHSKLVVIEIPDDAKNPRIEVDECGYERVAEGRVWGENGEVRP